MSQSNHGHGKQQKSKNFSTEETYGIPKHIFLTSPIKKKHIPKTEAGLRWHVHVISERWRLYATYYPIAFYICI